MHATSVTAHGENDRKQGGFVKKNFVIYIIWGSHYEEEHAANPCEYSFSTQAELDAFLTGVDAASGWLEYQAFNTKTEHKKWFNDRKKAVA
jgi:hypothetical protein